MDFTKRQIEIIQKATKLIGSKGLQNLTTKNLAAEMGFSEPALYRHFKGKTDILKSVLIFFKEEMKLGLKGILEDSNLNGLEKVHGILEFQFSHFSNNPAIVMVIFAETSFQYEKELSKTVLDILNTKKQLVEHIIETGQNDKSIRNDIDKEQLSTLIMGSMRFTILRWRLNEYNFNLVKEGENLWVALKKLL